MWTFTGGYFSLFFADWITRKFASWNQVAEIDRILRHHEGICQGGRQGAGNVQPGAMADASMEHDDYPALGKP